MNNDGTATLASDSSTLTPLPPVLHHGLAAVAILASFSLVSTTTVFFYLTYKLIRWRLKAGGAVRRNAGPTPQGANPGLGSEDRDFDIRNYQPRRYSDRCQDGREKSLAPNQFLVLVYNLFLADMHQAIAFILNAVWVHRNGIWVDDSTCFVQGWFVSTGDLASSGFIALIAVHTYFAVVWDLKFPQWLLNASIISTWSFVYVMAVAGVGGTRNGEMFGGFYVRASAWCWVNVAYENLRLFLHYLWIFISLALTSIIYATIFFSLRKRTKAAKAASQKGKVPCKILTQLATRGKKRGRPSQRSSGSNLDSPAAAQSGARHPAFLIYPVIYVICTAPLALGRIATMAGVSISLGYFCVAGALITSNGWLDVLLWSITRRELIYNSQVDEDDVGLSTFTFMRTPPDRKFGNMIWVEGGAPRPPGFSSEVLPHADESKAWRWSSIRGWFRTSTTASTGHKSTLGSFLSGSRGVRSVSEESLRRTSESHGGMAIQLDTVTTVAVEVDPDSKSVTYRSNDARYVPPSPSVYDTGPEKSIGQAI